MEATAEATLQAVVVVPLTRSILPARTARARTTRTLPSVLVIAVARCGIVRFGFGRLVLALAKNGVNQRIFRMGFGRLVLALAKNGVNQRIEIVVATAAGGAGSAAAAVDARGTRTAARTTLGGAPTPAAIFYAADAGGAASSSSSSSSAASASRSRRGHVGTVRAMVIRCPRCPIISTAGDRLGGSGVAVGIVCARV